MSKICFINGSPRKTGSCSHYLTTEIIKLLDDNEEVKEVFIPEILGVKKDIEEICRYDKVVIIFPLYIDSIPAKVTEFFIEFEMAMKNICNTNMKIYAISNCGFLEGEHNEIALKIVKLFANKINIQWGYGLGIGAGEFLRGSTTMPLKFFMKKDIYNALIEFSQNLENKKKTDMDVIVRPKMVRRLFIMFADYYWIGSAKKNGLSKRDLSRKTFVN